MVEIDMKSIQEECKRRFPIGCKFICAYNGHDENILKNDETVYSIDGKMIYASYGDGCLYNNGRYAKLLSHSIIKSFELW